MSAHIRPDRVAFRTQGLTRRFSTRESGIATEVRALDDVTMEVPAGIVFGFLGPNGAGKTTMIRLLLGLLEPTGGTAEVLGHDTRTHAQQIRECTGALLEHSGLYERLSAYDNLDFAGRIWHLPARERAARIRELLEQFGLWERRDDSVGTWSRGMKQKLAVARAILHRPQLVFLDEPTAGLDPIAAAALRADLAQLAGREGTSIFLTTHNLTEAEKLCSYIGVVARGRLIAAGHPDQLRSRVQASHLEVVGRGLAERLTRVVHLPGVKAVRSENGRLVFDLVPGTSAAPIVAALVQSGAEVEEVLKGAASLEEVFLSLVESDAD
jgi:ABC-2 type transport system ATP-binding protein